MLRFRSAEHPFDNSAVAGQAARLLALVESLGVWQPHSSVEVLDRRVFIDALGAIAQAGVGRIAAVEWERYADKAPEEFANWIKRLRDDVAASPVPELELPNLDALFGTERLSASLGVATSSLRRYLAQDRDVPDEVAERAHMLARIVNDVAGSYNERGVRRWFERPRPQLEGRAPAAILSGPWDPDDPDVGKVAALAAELAS